MSHTKHVVYATLSVAIAFGATSANAQNTVIGQSGKSIIQTANPTARASAAADIANAKSRLPMLKDLSKVPGYGGRTSQGFGTESHPFTTKGAYGNKANGQPVISKPWRSTGKLIMTFGSSTFVCTASVIKKGLLVTAAHCIQEFGQGAAGSATAVTFQPARHGSNTLYGTWTAMAWVVPTAYYNGTDTCSVSGVVCENDIALVVMNTGPIPPFIGKDIGQILGGNGFYHKTQGFTSFLGKTAAQITQLGYPVAFDSGFRMIRTDSLGFQEAPNNIIIGSDQTGGSSGGPWIMNFGEDPVSASSTPSFNHKNRVVAVTSWGFVSDALKVQGASRFNNNNAYPAPGPSNIEQLMADVCASYPTKC